MKMRSNLSMGSTLKVISGNERKHLIIFPREQVIRSERCTRREDFSVVEIPCWSVCLCEPEGTNTVYGVYDGLFSLVKCLYIFHRLSQHAQWNPYMSLHCSWPACRMTWRSAPIYMALLSHTSSCSFFCPLKDLVLFVVPNDEMIN